VPPLLTTLSTATASVGADAADTDPARLFAAGYAASFRRALAEVAGRDGLEAAAFAVTAAVTLGMVDEGEYGLAVELRVEAPDLDSTQLARLVEEADAVCPYSNAVRGNVEVSLLTG
jgi:lipoyl-dependent peroxiredoxin